MSSDSTGKADSSLFGSFRCMSSTRMMVLAVLCLQNSMFTVLRRYSQGVLREASLAAFVYFTRLPQMVCTLGSSFEVLSF